MVGDGGEHIGGRSPRIDGVEFGLGDQRVDHRGALATAVKIIERPQPAPEGNPARGADRVSAVRFLL